MCLMVFNVLGRVMIKCAIVLVQFSQVVMEVCVTCLPSVYIVISTSSPISLDIVIFMSLSTCLLFTPLDCPLIPSLSMQLSCEHVNMNTVFVNSELNFCEQHKIFEEYSWHINH